MLRTLSTLFIDNGYIQKEASQGLFYCLESESKKSFWLVVKDIDLSDILDEQSKLLKACQDVCDDPDLDKNLSLLVLSKVDSSSPSFKQTILDIEEDPYLFRKYVLRYASDEVTQLKNNFLNQSIPDFISQQLSNEETFQCYKTNPEEFGWQSLIYRVAIKLPFIVIKTGKKVEMSSLWSKKDKKISADNCSDLIKLDEIIFDHSSFDSIETMEPRDVLNLLSFSLDDK